MGSERHVFSLRLVIKNETAGAKSKEAPHVWGNKPWASGNGEEIKSDRLCCPCTVFLALSDQMMDGDGWWSNPLLDEGSCTSRVTPWGLLGKCQWKGGCFGGTRHSLGLLDQMSSPIQGVAFGICALDRG